MQTYCAYIKKRDDFFISNFILRHIRPLCEIFPKIVESKVSMTWLNLVILTLNNNFDNYKNVTQTDTGTPVSF